MADPDTPLSSRPGSQGSAPSESNYTLELPYAEELQALLEGKYMVESFLGQGGMGAVYRGLQLPLKRPVAIKILQKRQQGAEDDYGFEERFKREAYAMASLTHPNIVQVYDCGDAGENFLFISMELVEGGDLSDAIKEKQITPDLALKYIVQICDGLEAAHERGLVHRDIKPANIFLTRDGRAKVADFGLAKKFDAKNTMLTKTGLGMGTPDYAAPEQYEGASDLDHRADIYSLGVMFYQMLTGKLPRGVYKPASKRVAVDARLDGVIDKAMDPDRTQRYQRVSDMKAAIEQIIATWSAGAEEPQALGNTGAVPSYTGAVPADTSLAPLPQRPTSRPPRRSGAMAPTQATPDAQLPEPKKRNIGMVAGAVLAAVALLAAGAFMVLNKGEPEPQPSGKSVEHSSASNHAPSASTSVSREGASSPSVNSIPTAAAGNARFSSFVPGAEWRDGFAASEKWDQNWHRVGTEMHLAGQSGSMFAFSEMAVNSGIRARFRAQKNGAYFDLIQRHTRFNPGPRYVATLKAGERLNGSIDIIPPKDQGTRHRIASFTQSPPMGIGVEHTAELYAIGDNVTFFFDGEKLASVRDRTLADGFAAIAGGPGIEVIRVEMAVLEPSAPGGGMPVGEPLTFNGHRYQHFADSVGWAAAKARAEAAGGHLATITSKEENDWIVENYISKLARGGPGVWIGGESKGTRGEWRWVTKEPFAFTGWAPSEPQNVDHEFALMFMNKAPDGPGWTDMNPTGITSQDRRGGLLVEWDDASPPLATSAPKSSPSGGTGNLLEGFDANNGIIAGEWEVRNGELYAKEGGGFSRVAFDAPVPEEYDLHVSFTRTAGNNTVAVHAVLSDGQDVMYLMGGFGNKFFAWERVGGKAGNANPTTVPMGFESNQRQDCVVMVRKNRLAVQFNGKLLSECPVEPKMFDVASPWRYPDRGKLGVGTEQPVVFHKIELIPYVDQSAIAATSPPSPAMPSTPGATAASVQEPAPVALGDPRLEQLAKGFAARYEAEVEKVHREGVASLDQSYVNNGIGRAKGAAQQKGSSDEVAQLESEVQRIKNREPLPASDLDSLPTSLKQLRATYRASLAKLEAERAKKAAPLYDLYLAALDSYVAELTKADKIEQARKAQAVREEVAAKKTAMLGDAPVASSADIASGHAPGSSPEPSPAARASTIPPEVLSAPQKGNHRRELIEWVTKRPGFRIGYTQGNNRIQVSESNRREIPNSANIWLIDSGNQGRAIGFDASWLEGETDLEQLQLFQLESFKSPLVLRGMKKLQTLRITDNPQMLDDEAMRFFPPLPNLTLLDIHGAFGNEGLRIICERCPKLESVILNQRFVEGGLLPLTRLKGLKRAAFNQGEVAGPDVAAFGGLPDLQGLHLGVGCRIVGPPDLSALTGLLELTVENAGLTDAEVKTIAGLKKLTHLNLSANTGLTDAAITQLATLPKLTQLRMRSCGLKGLGGAAMPVFPALELFHIHGNAELDDVACAGLAKQKSLTSLFISESKVTDAGLQLLCDNLRHLTELNVSNTKVTDAGMTALRRAEHLKKLWLDNTAVTDVSVDALRKLTSLTELYVRRTSITPQAIATLEKSLPKCKVYSE